MYIAQNIVAKKPNKKLLDAYKVIIFTDCLHIVHIIMFCLYVVYVECYHVKIMDPLTITKFRTTFKTSNPDGDLK